MIEQPKRNYYLWYAFLHAILNLKSFEVALADCSEKLQLFRDLLNPILLLLRPINVALFHFENLNEQINCGLIRNFMSQSDSGVVRWHGHQLGFQVVVNDLRRVGDVRCALKK